MVGGGMAGMATAARLRAGGLSTVVLEAHWQPGGCAGFYRRRGFSFDVGATTLVDFSPAGVGGELLTAIGMTPPPMETLPGYVAWLPDRTVTLHRNQPAWHAERLRILGDSPAHRDFWRFLDHLSGVFWKASRAGIRLPVRHPRDLSVTMRALGAANLPLARHMFTTLGDALRRHGLRDDVPLVALLSMLVEDTVHSTVDEAPLINAALGTTIRGSGLFRAVGGMRGFWRAFSDHYRSIGGVLALNTRVAAIRGGSGDFRLSTSRGLVRAGQVVSAVPAAVTAAIGPPSVSARLAPYLARDADRLGGALVVFLGVQEAEVAGQDFTHHQLLQHYDRPLGDGNNMFVSVSSSDDLASAPAGHRAVMISTHCELAGWVDLAPEDYARRKREVSDRLIGYARRVFPELGRRAVLREVATPATYERFAGRPGGAVGGARLRLSNANSRAVPHDLGVPGFRVVGDSTWPGLGTVACAIGSRIVADDLARSAARVRRRTA
ncbi:MAG: phytoene desaturase family protein [Frankia sp.]